MINTKKYHEKISWIHVTNHSAREAYRLGDIVTFRLARLQAKLNIQVADVLDRHCGVSLTQWRLLLILSQAGVHTHKDITAVIPMDKGQISRSLKIMNAAGLITMTTSTLDQRSQHIALTGKGKAILKKMKPVMQGRQAHLLRAFSQTEKARLLDYMARLDHQAAKLDF